MTERSTASNAVRIESAEVGVFVLPLRLAPGEFRSSALALTVVRIRSTNGRVGHGYAYAWNLPSADALRVLLLGMAGSVIGLDVNAHAEVAAVLRRDFVNILGTRGMAMHGLSAIDIAMWDCACNELSLPVQTMLGASRRLVPAYVSGAGLRPEPAAAGRAAAALVARHNLGALKMWVSSGNVNQEAQRVAAVREAIGPNCKLMLDAVKSYTVREAIRLAEAVRDYDIEWLEDPLEPSLVWRGLSKVGQHSPVPIATGEDCYDIDDWQRLLDLEAVSVVLVDLQRVGGISGWRSVEALCSAAGVAVSSHHYPHIGVRLIASSARGKFVEYRPWWDEIFGPLEVLDGELLVPTGPGVCPAPVVSIEYSIAS